MSGGHNKSLFEFAQQIFRNLSIDIRKGKPLIWLLLVSLSYTVLAYRGDGLTIGGDSLIPLHPTKYMTRLLSSSNPWSGFGSSLPPTFSLPPVPDIMLFSTLSLLGFDIYTSNKIYVFVLATASAISIYFLATTIFHENPEKNLMGLVASVAFLYNPLVYADAYKTMVFMELSLVQTGFVLFIAFVIRYFQTMKVRYSFYAGFSSFLMFSYPGISAYRLTFLAMIAFFCVTLYHFVCCRGATLRTQIMEVVKGLSVVAALGFLLNSYWFIPFLQNSGYYSSFASEFQTTTAFNKFSNMANTLRLSNSWSFHAGFVPYADVYLTNPVIIGLTFSWPLLAFLPLLSRKAITHRKILALCLATILTILFVWGSESLFGQFYMTVVNITIGPYYFLRPFYNTGPISQLVLTLEYAVLIGFSSSLVYSLLARKSERFNPSRRKIAGAFGPILIVTILASSSWPILTGDVMRSWYRPDQYGVRIPDRYWEANEYLEKTCGLNHRTLLLPPTEVYIGNSWGFQGTSQFYNLMFNVPLITGNEVPYGITSNENLVRQVYSIYYQFPDINDTLEVPKHTSKIKAWQSDSVILANDFVQIDFNNTYQIDSWHEVELDLPFANTWSNFTHMIVQFTAELSLDHLQIGIGDTERYVGWWSAQTHVHQVSNGSLIPTETALLVTQNNGTITLLANLEEPDSGEYSIIDVTSVWIRYFVTDSPVIPQISINKMSVAKPLLDVTYYAELLANNNVKYLLVDLSIKDGAKSDPQFWLDMLSSSNYFELIWQRDTLYIFENTMLL